MKTGSFQWPKAKDGTDKLVAFNPQLQINMCSQCWNGKHNSQAVCTHAGCECGCYTGRTKGLRPAHLPAKDCKEQEKLPDVGTITIG